MSKDRKILIVCFIIAVVFFVISAFQLAHGQEQKMTPEQQAIYNILTPHNPVSLEVRALFEPNWTPPVKTENTIVRKYKVYDDRLALNYALSYCATFKPTAKHPRVQRVYLKHGDIYNCADKSVTLAGAK